MSCQQILLTVAAGVPSRIFDAHAFLPGAAAEPRKHKYARLSPKSTADWQAIRKALFLALSVTSNPDKAGDTYLTLFDCGKYYPDKTASDADKSYMWTVEALAKGFSSLWKGQNAGQDSATLKAGLDQIVKESDPLWANVQKVIERGSSYPVLRAAYEEAMRLISVGSARRELAAALALYPTELSTNI